MSRIKISMLILGLIAVCIMSALPVYAETINYAINDGNLYSLSSDVLNPSAVYAPSVNRTYLTIHGYGSGNLATSNLDPYVMYYDHTTGTMSEKVKAGINPWATDGHGCPTILRDKDGYIHVFYGCHGNPIQHAKTVHPDDISSWEIGTAPGNLATYPHPILANDGTIYIIYREDIPTLGNHSPICFVKSSDNGETWTLPKELIDHAGYNGINDYVLYAGKISYNPSNGLIYIGWMRYNSPIVSEHRNVYFAYFSTIDNHLYRADMTDLGTEAEWQEAESCLVYADAINRCHDITARFDTDGVPYIIFNNEGTFKFTKWNGNSWVSPQIITTTENVYWKWQLPDDFIVYSPTNIEAFLDTRNAVERWVYDGNIWTKAETILVDTDGTYESFPEVVDGFNPTVKITISQSIAGYYTPTKGWLWGDSGFAGAMQSPPPQIPLPPTNVIASDGTYTDKVVVSWQPSASAQGYYVYRNGTQIANVGLVTTYNDLTANAPIINAGVASASDGTLVKKISLNLSGQSATTGNPQSYYVVAYNSLGNSTNSLSDSGYRGIGTLSYQWQRSSGDFDADYSNITGATTVSYIYNTQLSTGNYYRCTVSATGVESPNSVSDRGYAKINGKGNSSLK